MSESSLQRELKQTKPFPSLGTEAVLALFRTADRVRHRIKRQLDPYGITQQQYNVLRILRGAGEAGLPTLEICERMVERAPGITRLLDRMEAKGWVSRQRCREDRRQVLCHATKPGLELLERLDAPVREIDDAVVGSLENDQKRALIDLLARVRDGIRPPGGEACVSTTTTTTTRTEFES